MTGIRRSLGRAGLPLALVAIALAPVLLRTVDAATAGDTYVPLSPVRVLDTRLGGQPLGPGGSLTLALAGVGEVPQDATAVSVNVTVTDTTAASFLTVYPAGETQPVSSNLNWSQGQTVANLVMVPVGSGGALTFYNASGEAQLVVDLQGYFVASGGPGGDYVPLTPERITDTRAGSGYPNAGQTLGPGGSLAVQVAGAGGVPATGVGAAVLNVTATDTTLASYLAVYPEGEADPGTSALNWEAGSTVANRVVVPLGPSGQVTVQNQSGRVDVVVDVSGYFTTASSSLAAASLFYPVSPTRVLDTRSDGNQMDQGGYLGQQLAGVDGISAQATAVVANLTATDTSSAGYFTLSPAQAPVTTSDLNWPPGATVANLDIASLGTSGDAYLYNDQGSADAVIDLFGYFEPLSGANPAAPTPCTGVTISATSVPVGSGPVAVSAQASCGSGQTPDFDYWYLAPGSSVWRSAGAWSDSASFQYSTTGWADGSYQLMAWASSQPGVFQGAVGTSPLLLALNPSSNDPDTFIDSCYGAGFASASCGQAELSAVDTARAGEGLGPVLWPSALSSLPDYEQEFVLADEERVSRDLAPIPGLTAPADQNALLGAQDNTDPDPMALTGAIGYASNWAEDYGSLGAMYDWMYNDGPGSFNLDCPTAGSPGCWVHRDDILLDTTSGSTAAQSGYSWVGGTACAPESGVSYLDACSLEWVEIPTDSVSYSFTWAQAVALGA